jgi:hypothetical protein
MAERRAKIVSSAAVWRPLRHRAFRFHRVVLVGPQSRSNAERISEILDWLAVRDIVLTSPLTRTSARTVVAPDENINANKQTAAALEDYSESGRDYVSLIRSGGDLAARRDRWIC